MEVPALFGKKKKQQARNLNIDVEENISSAEIENNESNEKPEKKKGKEKKEKVKKNKKGAGLKVPKTVQDSIPYLAMYRKGICELDPGIYSKTYKVSDANFKTATDEEQVNMFNRYMDYLNSFDSDVHLQLVIYNRTVNSENIEDHVLLPFAKDNLNAYREEYNEILRDKMKEGRNNMQKEIYESVTIKANSLDEATQKFAKLDTEVGQAIKRINSMEPTPMDLVERLEILNSIYGKGDDSFYKKAKIDGHDVESYNFKWMIEQGLTTKDIIGPPSITFNRSHAEIGDKFTRSYYIDTLPSYINANLLTELTDVDCEMLVSVNYNKMPADRAYKLLKNQLLNINANVVEAQKRAIKNGYDPSIISHEIIEARDEAQALIEDVRQRNQSLILTTFVITIMGNSVADLNKYADSINSVLSKYMCSMKVLNYQQENGLASSLPLGRCDIAIDRLLTTESAAIFMPFSTQELNQRRGMFYGLNAVSKNLILFNRKDSKNANGVILGTPGSGKSFAAKREMINVILNTDDDIYIIDPEREYLPLAQLLGGSVVKITTGGTTYLNPLDMDINYGLAADDEKNVNPIAMKVDFIGGLFEAMAGNKKSLTSAQLSVLDRCITLLYTPYLQHMKELQKTHPEITCDTTKSPTLKQLHELLLNQQEYEAQELALCAERFAVGSLDNFAHHTNVKRNNRFIVYDIKDMGESMKELGLKVCLNAIWNQMIENKSKNRWTWFYIDEFYLLTQTQSSATFLQMVYKRARKWQGIPTGITQNVSDLLSSQTVCSILQNCEFVLMLNQAQADKMQLAQMYNISPTQLSYVTNADPGQGLIYTGKTIVPFVDKFPKDTMLYKVMSTKPDEIIE